MKKILILLLLFSLCITVLSQEQHTKEYYLQKSKKQKTTAWILTAGGVVVGIIGLSQINLAGEADGEVNNTPGTILFATGGVATITGIILFTKAGRNKKRAINVTTGINIKSYPSQ